jgi:hypothetical protein
MKLKYFFARGSLNNSYHRRAKSHLYSIDTPLTVPSSSQPYKTHLATPLIEQYENFVFNYFALVIRYFLWHLRCRLAPLFCRSFLVGLISSVFFSIFSPFVLAFVRPKVLKVSNSRHSAAGMPRIQSAPRSPDRFHEIRVPLSTMF